LGVTNKNPPFLEAGCCIISFLIYDHAPPPAEVIIMTTTIIIAEILAMTLLIEYFNMEGVCFVNIHPPFGKKNCGKQKIKIRTRIFRIKNG